MSYSHLTLQKRYVIYHLVLYSFSYREIGRRLNRHHTTIRQEVQRNGPRYTDDGAYWHDYSMTERTGVDICQRTMGENLLPSYGSVGSVKRPVRSRMRSVVEAGGEKPPATRLCR